jgi:uncharacterized Zn ribbon protein
MQKRCLNPKCNQLFESIRLGELQCPHCRGVRDLLGDKRKAQEKPAQSVTEVLSVKTENDIELSETAFIRCLNVKCSQPFHSDGHMLYCPNCAKADEKKPEKTFSSKGAKVCATPECRQVFYGVGDSLICPLCERIQKKAEQESEEDSYEKIKDYLIEHQNATVDEIHVATKVPINRVKKMIDEGRFQLVLMPKCKQCNGPIVNGRPGQEMCLGCLQKMRNQMMKPLDHPVTDVRVSMHIQARDSHRGR